MLLVQGSGFNWPHPDHFRLVFLPHEDDLREAINRVARLKVEVAGLKTVADDVATRINGDVENAFTTMFEQIGSGAKSASDAFGDFARSVLSAINRIAAQKIAEGLFGSMTKGGSGGLGGLISGLFQSAGFASGGYVTGPGTGTSDSIPARLSAGEYALRADAVRRVGIEFLHALNGGLFMPRDLRPRRVLHGRRRGGHR